jgi:hypothetical protein
MFYILLLQSSPCLTKHVYLLEINILGKKLHHPAKRMRRKLHFSGHSGMHCTIKKRGELLRKKSNFINITYRYNS